MKKMSKKIMAKKAKGFTLVELIVVMIILAILAALLVPSMTGYIDKARNQSAIVEARQVLVAAQTIASENYYKNASMEEFTTTQKTEILTLAEITTNGDNGKFTSGPVITKGKGKIASFEYTTTAGIKVKYDASTTDKFTIVTT